MPGILRIKGRGHKYRAVATTVDGIRFASKAEARRYGELKLDQEVKGLELQPRYPLSVGLITIGFYVADFSYFRNGVHVVEDVKGMKTALYKWKAKHFEAQYGYKITEITK